MDYAGTLTWDELVQNLTNHSRNLRSNLYALLEEYNEWQRFRAGRTNAVIAIALAVTETQVAEMDAAFAAFKEIFDFTNNVAPSQGDRFFSLRQFQ